MHSQRWIFTSPGGENEYKRHSVSREHCDAVIEAKSRETHIATEMDRKKRDMESAMWEKMTKKVLEAKIKQQEDNDKEMRTTPSSSYAETFVKEGFKVRELGTEIDEELERKYNLYKDTAISINVKNAHDIKAKDPIHKPLSSMFRRDNRFTSRLSNPMDIHRPVAPGHFAYV